jgi:hypothetical protein
VPAEAGKAAISLQAAKVSIAMPNDTPSTTEVKRGLEGLMCNSSDEYENTSTRIDVDTEEGFPQFTISQRTGVVRAIPNRPRLLVLLDLPGKSATKPAEGDTP